MPKNPTVWLQSIVYAAMPTVCHARDRFEWQMGKGWMVAVPAVSRGAGAHLEAFCFASSYLALVSSVTCAVCMYTVLCSTVCSVQCEMHWSAVFIFQLNSVRWPDVQGRIASCRNASVHCALQCRSPSVDCALQCRSASVQPIYCRSASHSHGCNWVQWDALLCI